MDKQRALETYFIFCVHWYRTQDIASKMGENCTDQIMKRKRLTNNQKLELWEKYEGRCWRCGIKIDKHKRGQLHWGHIIAHSLGGASDPSNMAPECAGCNQQDARMVVTPLAAKTKRIAIRNLERPEPKMKLSRKMNGDVCRWNPETRKYDILVWSNIKFRNREHDPD